MSEINFSSEIPKINVSSEYLKMYEIPGQEKITEHSFNRYKRDKIKFDQDIKDQIINSSNPSIEKTDNISESERVELITRGLDSDNIGVQKASAERIRYIIYDKRIPELRKKVTVLIKNGLDNGDIEIKKAYAEMIEYASQNERGGLIINGFADNNVEVKKICAKMIEYASQNERGGLIINGLSIDNIEIQKTCVRMIKHAYESERYGLLIKGFNINNIEVQKTCAEMIYCVCSDNPDNCPSLDSLEKRKKLIKIALSKKLGNYLVEPPLYRGTDISKNKLSRIGFEKTGSDITLIGGNLKDKTIIRHIDLESFMAWQKIYENYELWKNSGFNYVPIEPIQSFKLNEKGFVDVYSGVLDLSLGSWKDISNKFVVELNKDKEKIKKVLDKNKISHGHMHSYNFCLSFFRDKNDNVDFNKKPRIYLIDFDNAGSAP